MGLFQLSKHADHCENAAYGIRKFPSHTGRYRLAVLAARATVFFALGLSITVGARPVYIAGPASGDDSVFTKESATQIVPNTQYRIHNINKVALMVTNFGTFGSGYIHNSLCDGEECPSCEYPINSKINYLGVGAIWIGAVIGHDTLVSVGGGGGYNQTEMLPAAGPEGDIIARSYLRSRIEYDDRAVSEQDYICDFADTLIGAQYSGWDEYEGRLHHPLGITVRQSSFAWSYDYAEDFILFDYQIVNVGRFPIRDMFIGFFIDGDVTHRSRSWMGFLDDLCGFRQTVDMPQGFGFEEDTVNISWAADNNGDPTGEGEWEYRSPVAAVGIRVLRGAGGDVKYNYNWWVPHQTPSMDFGPRLAGGGSDPFRSFGYGLGTPVGDLNRYYMLSHREFDYDQMFTAISHTGEGFLPPPKEYLANDIANGNDSRSLLSFGPLEAQPGDTIPITMALIMGDNFHDDPLAFNSNFNPLNPNAAYSHFNFEDLGKNARWADWVFDNPGYDTPTDEFPEGDGDAGRFNWACPDGDTVIYYPETELPPEDIIDYCTKVYYKGDGVPDYRGASPPPPPVIRVTSELGKVIIRWNGEEAEEATDFFTGYRDFEGYRVYYGEDDRLSDFVLLATYDKDDFRVIKFNNTYLRWEQLNVPLTRDSLQLMYGATFDPNLYESERNTFVAPDGDIMYFIPQDWNQSDLADPLLIHKVYPDAVVTDTSDTTEDGHLRYYEYEYIVPNLLPSRPYYFAVTAFDYGSLNIELGALESSPLVNAILEYPLPSSETVEAEGLNVTVYPNPYRIDAGYARIGFENRDRSRSAEWSRSIHFANLPNVCTIRIFTIDGDLIKQIEHNYPEGGPGSQHEEWNMISRNTQVVVTGIYLWHVTSQMGDQVGKLVIMK